jgi:hypothetical protein
MSDETERLRLARDVGYVDGIVEGRRWAIEALRARAVRQAQLNQPVAAKDSRQAADYLESLMRDRS